MGGASKQSAKQQRPLLGRDLQGLARGLQVIQPSLDELGPS